MTCILHVKEYSDTGMILEAGPKLHGYDVATGLVQQFDDIMVIGQMSKDGGAMVPRIQLAGRFSRNTKDLITKEIRKTMNFTPRLTGTNMTEAPAHVKVDLSKLIEYKAAGAYIKAEKK